MAVHDVTAILDSEGATGPTGAAILEVTTDLNNFAATLGTFARAHPGRDIVLVWPGLSLPYAWQARLRKAAYAAPRIAAAIPMCDIAPLFELIDAQTGSKQQFDSHSLDSLAYCLGHRAYYEIPRLHPVCAYLRRDALESVLPSLDSAGAGVQGVLDEFARQVRARGWSCVICDYLYVERPARARVASTDAFEDQAFMQHHPLGSLRRAVRDVLERGLHSVPSPGLDTRPVQLHIAHFWGGGSDKWVRDFGGADSQRINMILSSYRIGESGGQRLVLYTDPQAMVPIRTWDIAQPIRASVSASIEYRRILEQVIEEFDVEAIFVSSLIGHALDALTQPVKTVVVCHDFYPVCQAINPQFGKTCGRCTLDDLKRCEESNPLNDIFRGFMSADEWHAMRSLFVEHVLGRGIELVTPSPSVAATLKKLDPRLASHPIRLIAHGDDLDASPLPYPARAAGQRLRIVVPGRLTRRQKGTDLLREACEILKPHAEITLLGCGKEGVELAQACGLAYVERYDAAALPGLLRSIAPHAGLLPSVVPETFSYTLSELRAMGIPPIATALGSFVDRIEHGETGFLFEPTAGALAEIVGKLHADPGLLEHVAGKLAALPKGRSCAQMVSDYHAIVPLAPRAAARFRVGIGRESGLTEPYRHLAQAYRDLTTAYSDMSTAYDGARLAYAQSRQALEEGKQEFEGLRTFLDDWNREFDALQIRRHWWHAPKAARLLVDLRRALRSRSAASLPRNPADRAAIERWRARFPWAEALAPHLLKSPWWIGHIPFAFELVARLRPRVLVELGTYSGSSFAAFCQAFEACGIEGHCYGVDLWEGDVHMGRFDEGLFREISDYMGSRYPAIARLVRKDFNAAAHDFAPGSIDLLHIDGTHTYEAVSNDFHTWLPKLSDRAVVLFHDVNVNEENTGPSSKSFGVRRFFDGVAADYPHFDFAHCWGLGVLVVGRNAPAAVMELVDMSGKPGFAAYFAWKGAQVSQRFEQMGVDLPSHSPYSDPPAASAHS